MPAVGGAQPPPRRMTVYSDQMSVESQLGIADFPRQWARTRRFSLGVPRRFTVSQDGGRVLFLRTRSGGDPMSLLWCLEVESGRESLIADPDVLSGGAGGSLAPEERARRERARERSSGIVSYSADPDAGCVAFSLDGSLWVSHVGAADSHPVKVLDGQAVSPTLAPTGDRIAYVKDRALRVVGTDGSDDRELARPESDDVSYGLAEFVAAEEMGRSEGFWWSPAGDKLLVARTDVSRVERWYLADAASPSSAPAEIRYPAAGTSNADVQLSLVDLDGSEVPVVWDRDRFEYLVSARWGPSQFLVVVQSRDQRVMQVLDVDPLTGQTAKRREDRDPHWVDVVAGTPAVTSSGDLVWTVRSGDTRSLLVGEEVRTPAGLQVRSVVGVSGDDVVFAGSDEPTELHLWRWGRDGLTKLTGSPGVHMGWVGGRTLVVSSERLDDGTRTRVRAPEHDLEIESVAESPVVTPQVRVERTGQREIRTALLLPSWHELGSGRLPVLMDPYAGPQHTPASRMPGGATWTRSGSLSKGLR